MFSPLASSFVFISETKPSLFLTRMIIFPNKIDTHNDLWSRVTVMRSVTTSLAGLCCEQLEHVAAGIQFREPCDVCSVTAALPSKFCTLAWITWCSDTDTSLWEAWDGKRNAREGRLKRWFCIFPPYCTSYSVRERENVRDSKGEVMKYIEQYNVWSDQRSVLWIHPALYSPADFFFHSLECNSLIVWYYNKIFHQAG